jgi:hypothetical protein
MKRFLFLAIAATLVSATTMAQGTINPNTVNATTVNVSSKIKLKTKTITGFQTDLNFNSDSLLPTSKAVKAYVNAYGGGGAVNDLQTVTTAGNITTNQIVTKLADNSFRTTLGPGGVGVVNNVTQSSLGFTFDKLTFADQNSFTEHVLKANPNPLSSVYLQMPNGDGNHYTIPVSVNGITANEQGNIILPINNSGWSLTGNTGTNQTNNFIGTTDAQDLVFKVNNAYVGSFKNTGGFAVGSANATSYSTIANGQAYANGGGSVAFGGAYTYGTFSIAAGYLATSKTFGGAAFGVSNDETDNPNVNQFPPASTSRIFQIGNGNGNSPQFRKNAMTVLYNGNVGINVLAPTAKLDLKGTIKIEDGTQALGRVLTTDASGLSSWQDLKLKQYTVATLPAAGVQGRIAYVTDAISPTYLGTLNGGGTQSTPVFDNGTSWVSH